MTNLTSFDAVYTDGPSSGDQLEILEAEGVSLRIVDDNGREMTR